MAPIPRIAAWLKRLSPAIGIACFAIALLVLGRALRDTTPEALARQLATFPRQRILAALALTLLDFVPLIGLDWYALRVMKRRLPFPVLARASLAGYAFSRAVGLAVLSGSAIRYRLCGRHGLYALDIAKLVAIAAVISWLGFLLVGGVALLAAPLSALTSFRSEPDRGPGDRSRVPCRTRRPGGRRHAPPAHARHRPAPLRPPTGARHPGDDRRRLDRLDPRHRRPLRAPRAGGRWLRGVHRGVHGGAGGRRGEQRAGRDRRLRDRDARPPRRDGRAGGDPRRVSSSTASSTTSCRSPSRRSSSAPSRSAPDRPPAAARAAPAER